MNPLHSEIHYSSDVESVTNFPNSLDTIIVLKIALLKIDVERNLEISNST